MYQRLLNIQLPEKQSIFLWGARQTGKSSFLKTTYPQACYYDLLDTRQLSKFSHSPHLLREEVLAKQDIPIIIIDEIQKAPALLNEVHWLIEHLHAQFILCGSSARTLKTATTNLLGGRAWQYNFYPLTWAEVPDFQLLRALQHGLVPRHYQADPTYITEYLQAYVDVYLTDEIRNQGLVRNLQGFSRFLEVAGMCNTEMINLSNIARDCSVNRTSVQAYFQILIDTLLGYYVHPYQEKIKRDIVTHMPKFYFFDLAIGNFLGQQSVISLKGEVAGKSFENFIAMELHAYRGLKRKRHAITYWRTKHGLEVDFILGRAEVAIEVKISEQVHQQDLKGLIGFCEEHPNTKAIVVSQDPRPRLLTMGTDINITILPWQDFLAQLWAGDII